MTNQSLKRIHLLFASSGLILHGRHVASRDNVSNALSWEDVAGFLTGYPTASEKISLDPPERALHTMLRSLRTPRLIVCDYGIRLFQASPAGLPGLGVGIPLDGSKHSPSND